MTTEFKTRIRNMERYLEDGFVYCVHWEITADSGTCQVNRIGQVGFEREEGVTITPFDQLTEVDVMAWIAAHVDVSYMNTLKQSMTDQIAELTSAPVTAVGMPWLLLTQPVDAPPHDVPTAPV